MNKEIVEKLNYIYNYFDHPEVKQREKLKEEAKEFLDDPNNSELADILVLCLQLFLNDCDVRKEFYFKLNRTIERIKNGYYNK